MMTKRASPSREASATQDVALDHLLDELLRRRYVTAVRVAHLLLGNVAAAEDVVQEAFARVYVRLGSMADPGEADGYLITVVINLARRTLRRASLARAAQAVRLGEGGGHAPGGEEPADRQVVVAALRQVSRRQRECLVLRYFLSFTEAEIAAELGISAGSVKTHTARGLEAMARLLGERP